MSRRTFFGTSCWLRPAPISCGSDFGFFLSEAGSSPVFVKRIFLLLAVALRSRIQSGVPGMVRTLDSSMIDTAVHGRYALGGV